MKKVYEAPSLEFEVIETEEVMLNASFEEGGDMSTNSIFTGDIDIDL